MSAKKGEEFKINSEVIADPTNPRREMDCQVPSCESTTVVTFCNPTKEGMDLYFVCKLCQHSWKKQSLDAHDLDMTEAELDGDVKPRNL
jgi:hypothetical protein